MGSGCNRGFSEKPASYHWSFSNKLRSPREICAARAPFGGIPGLTVADGFAHHASSGSELDQACGRGVGSERVAQVVSAIDSDSVLLVLVRGISIPE